MPGTFSQIYIQVVFAVKNRGCLIKDHWADELYKYISGIIENKGQKVLAINGMPDHIHIFFGMKPTCNRSDMVREIKKASTLFINERRLSQFKFEWQGGYGAFSYSHSAVSSVINYIRNQKEHHKKATFKQEYTKLLNQFEVVYGDRYLFEWLKND